MLVGLQDFFLRDAMDECSGWGKAPLYISENSTSWLFMQKLTYCSTFFPEILHTKGPPIKFFFKYKGNYISTNRLPCIFKSGLHTWMEFYLINLTSVAYYISFNIFIITNFKWRHVMKKMISLAPIACSVSENAIFKRDMQDVEQNVLLNKRIMRTQSPSIRQLKYNHWHACYRRVKFEQSQVQTW